MTGLLHVVPGPEQHGVVRHGLGVQAALAGEGVELLRCERLDDLGEGALAGRVVAVQVTDRVLAGDPEAALETWRRVVTGVARLTVVLHDLPQRSDGDRRRSRSRLYALVAASADEVVVASHHERLLLAAALRWACPRHAAAVLGRTHVIPLPIERDPRAPGARPSPTKRTTVTDRAHDSHAPGARSARDPQASTEPLTVVTLGFVYPGKGLEEVIDASALAARDPRLAGRRIEVRNLGRASLGHEDLADELAARATTAGITWSTSGWVDDAALPGLLAAATVPVAAHRHVSASGSIATWLAAGRRPVVLASRYAEELAARIPGALNVLPVGSAQDVVSGLATAIADALAETVTTDVAGASAPPDPTSPDPAPPDPTSPDPTSPDPTWLHPDTRLGPSWAESATALLKVATRPAVSVVVPYYRDQRLLDLILERLAAQTGVVGGLEVVVADDGSPQPPDLGAGPGVDRPEGWGAIRSARLVRQARAGFRAAAARNLGARHTGGRVVCFLDGDTVPEEGYLSAMQRACLAAPTLAVGRRRHADLARGWPPVEALEEPEWLAQGYRASEDLRAADDASFRFVISAVLAVSRTVWDAVGGFEEGLTGYGGEDWELAWRCWLAGADLRHVPEAVAWHDGPDLAGRERDPQGMAEVKNAETLRLAPLLPHPLVRGQGWTHPQPDVVAVLQAAGWSEGQLVVAVESLLRAGDVGVWIVPPPGGGGLADPRVHVGHPTSTVLARARAVVRMTRPVAVLRWPWAAYPSDLSGALAPGSSPLVREDASGVQVVATRHAARTQLHGDAPPPTWLPEEWVELLSPDLVIERWRG